MKTRALLVGAGLATFGGLALYDYNSPDSRRARELHDVEKLKPDVALPACLPQGPLAKPFAVAATAEALPPNSFENDARKRGTIKHDCIRGAAQHSIVDKLVGAAGDDLVPYAAKVVQSCPQGKLDYPPIACTALDVLGQRAMTSAAAVTALEKFATERKTAKEVWEGALYRLIQTSWHTPAQLAAQLTTEPEWEARELLLEKIREKRDSQARGSLEAAYAKESDPGTKGHIKAALLELDNPGRCVVEDEGLGEDGICRYVCRDQNLRLRYPKNAKAGSTCPMVRDPEKPSQVDTAALTK